MEISIIKAAPEAYTEGIALYQAAARRLRRRGLSQWSYWLDPPPARVEWMRDGFAKGEAFFFSVDGEAAGMYRLLDTDELYWGERGSEPATRYLHSFILRDGMEGKGIGRELITALLLALRSEKPLPLRLRLDCVADNPGLRAYYQGLGFRKVGTKVMPQGEVALFEREV